MKKTIYFAFIMLLTACMESFDSSFDSFVEKWDLSTYQTPVCSSVTDAVYASEGWTGGFFEKFTISDETISSMSTCGLFETLINHPIFSALGPWMIWSSSTLVPGVTRFNDSLKNDKVAIEFFKRADCFSVLSSKYLSIIKGMKEFEKNGVYFQKQYFEMLLASDLLMAKLNEKEKIQLLAMALERRFDKDERATTPCLVISILTSCAYPPFMEEVRPYLVEGTDGYYDSRYENVTGRLDYSEIIAYAKKFLNEKK